MSRGKMAETLLNYVAELLSHSKIILFHSHAGVSRSAAVVTAYIMKTDNLSFEEAYSKLKAIKPDVR